MRSSPAQVALLVVAAFAAAEALRSTVVRTSLGTAKGKIYKSSNGGDGEALVFLGLPYAAPPVGALRYRQPQDPKSWSRILDASEYRSACLSNTSFTTSPQTDIDEDCLYVNVFADRRCGKRSHAPCPVLFYIHGGGYSFDSASMFPVQALVDHFATRELVFVTVGYRLGSFGFLDLGSDDVVNRNIGFYDKIKALEWVQREIGKFGGDPKKVTIMGHSSGSMSVGLLSMSPMKNVAGHLFHQGIPMSGPPSITKDTNVQATLRLAEHAQCATKEHWDEGHFEPIIDCLRNKSALELLGWQRTIEEQDGAGFFGPSIDGPNGLFPADVPTMMKSRPAIPYMTGTTSKEFTFPLPIPDQVLASEQAYRAACKMVVGALGFSNVDAVADACTNYYSKTKILASEMMSEMFFVGTLKDAQSVRDAGAPVYLYSFDYPKISFHSADLGFVMGIHTIEQDATDDKLEIIYSGYFANFARVGRPADEWQPMKVPDGSNYFSIDYSDSNGTKVRPHNVDSYHPDTMRFWLVEAPKIDASSRNNQTTTTTKSTTTTASNDRKSTTTATTTTQRVQPATKAVRNGDKNEAEEAAQEVRSEKIVKAEPVVSSAASNWETAFWVAICGCIALSLVFVVMGTLRLFKAKRAPHIIADERTSLLHDYRNGSVKQVY